jgi:hypothetical protein
LNQGDINVVEKEGKDIIELVYKLVVFFGRKDVVKKQISAGRGEIKFKNGCVERRLPGQRRQLSVTGGTYLGGCAIAAVIPGRGAGRGQSTSDVRMMPFSLPIPALTPPVKVPD